MRMVTNGNAKWIGVASTAILLAGVTAGCSSNNNNAAESSGSASAPSASASASPSPSASANKEPVKIVFWHYLTDRKDLLEQMAKDFTAQTGIEVDVELFGGDGFKQKVIASAQGRQLPDILTLSGGAGDLAPLIQNKNILELSQDESALMAQIPESILNTYTYKEGNAYQVTDYGTYAMPMDTNDMMFMYNKDLFAKAGITAPPSTWQELLDDVDKLKACGITPLATGLGSWVGTSMTEPYMYAYLGDDKLRATKAGEEPMVGSDWVKVLDIYKQLADHKAFAAGISTMDLPKAEQLFANGQAAMLFDGSWAIGVMNQLNPDFKNFDAFLPPKPADAAYDVKIPGGVGVPLVVNADTKHKEETLKFMEFLLSKEQQQKYASSSFNLPANKEASSSEGAMSDALVHFSQGMTSVYQNAAPFKGDTETVMQKGIQLIVLGQSTPEKVVKQMEDATKKGAAAK